MRPLRDRAPVHGRGCTTPGTLYEAGFGSLAGVFRADVSFGAAGFAGAFLAAVVFVGVRFAAAGFLVLRATRRARAWSSASRASTRSCPAFATSTASSNAECSRRS